MISFARLLAMAVKPPRLPVRQPPPLLRVHAAARGRRLSDKIRVAFHAACDEGAFEIAERLLTQLDSTLWSDLATMPLFAYPGLVATVPNISGVRYNPSASGVTYNVNQWTLNQ